MIVFFKVKPKAGKKKKGLITDYYPVQSKTRINKQKAKSNPKRKPKKQKQTKMTDYYQPASRMDKAIKEATEQPSKLRQIANVIATLPFSNNPYVVAGQNLYNLGTRFAEKYVQHKHRMTNQNRYLKEYANRTAAALDSGGYSRSNAIFDKWKNARMKKRIDYHPYLQDVMVEAIKRQNDLLEKEKAFNEAWRERYAQQNPYLRSPLKPDEFGKIKDPLTDTYIPQKFYEPFRFNKEVSRKLTKKEKEMLYMQRAQKAIANKDYYKERMEHLLANPNEPNALMERRINDISDEYKELVKNETHDFISHPEEILFQDDLDNYKWSKYTKWLKHGTSLFFDVARLANEEGNPVSAVKDIILKKLKGKPFSGDIAAGTASAISANYEAHEKLYKENSAQIEKELALYNQHKNQLKKAIEEGRVNNIYIDKELPDITLNDLLKDKSKWHQFSGQFRHVEDEWKRFEKLNKETKMVPDNTLEKIKEGLIDTAKNYAAVPGSVWGWIKSTTPGIWAADKWQTHIQGKSDEEMARIKADRGDLFDDKFKQFLVKDDDPELSMEDRLGNLNKHLQYINDTFGKLNMKDIVGLEALGYDFRFKNKNIDNELVRKAHNAFILHDAQAKLELNTLGINSIDDIRKRKEDFYEYAFLRNADLSEAEELFKKLGGLPRAEYDRIVRVPLNKMKVDRHIDVSEGFLNKMFNIYSLDRQTNDLKKAYYASLMNLHSSREGKNSTANNNRVRDFIKSTLNPTNKAEDNPTQNKIKNQLIAQLTGLMDKTGFMSDEEEKQLITDFGKKFFKINSNDGLFKKGTILDAQNLMNEKQVEAAHHRIENFADFRQNWMKSKGIVPTRETFNEIATSNTGINPMARTKGQRDNIIRNMVNQTVFNEDDTTLKPAELYEKNKRKAKFQVAIEENYVPMMTILDNIENKQYISLKKLDEMEQYAKTNNNEEALINYAKDLNRTIHKTSNHYSYRRRNDDIQDNPEYFKDKFKEYSEHALFPQRVLGYKFNIDDGYHIPAHKIVDDKSDIYFRTNTIDGDEYTTKFDTATGKNYLYDYRESDQFRTLNNQINPDFIESSVSDSQAYHDYLSAHRVWNEANIAKISREKDLNRFF